MKRTICVFSMVGSLALAVRWLGAASFPTPEGALSSHAKQMTVNGTNVTLSVERVVEGGLLRIRKHTDGSDANVSVVVAEMALGKTGPDGIDLAVSPDGRLLWVLVELVHPGAQGSFRKVYPFVRGADDPETYHQCVTNMPVRDANMDVYRAFDLSGRIRDYAAESYKKGKPIHVGRKTGNPISDVRLAPTNSGDVAVIGRLGTNYSFTGILRLNLRGEPVCDGFRIEPATDKPLDSPRE